MSFLARIVLMLVHPRLFWGLDRWRRGGRRGRYGGGGRWLIHPVFTRRVRPLPDRGRFREIGVRRTRLRRLRRGFLSGAMEYHAAGGARYGIVDVPRLLERLDPERFREKPRMAPINRALHVLDF